ncbi:TrbI/VirB10 family protein [Vibrio mediterranei]
MTLSERLQAFLKRGEHSEFHHDDLQELNQGGQRRNALLLSAVAGVLVLLAVIYLFVQKITHHQSAATSTPVQFDAVLDEQYASEDAQSAERLNEANITDLQQSVTRLKRQNTELLESGKAQQKALKVAKQALEQSQAEMSRALEEAKAEFEQTLNERLSDIALTPSQDKAANTDPLTGKGKPATHTPPFSTHVDPFEYPSYEKSTRYDDDSQPELKTLKRATGSQPRGIDTFIIDTPTAGQPLRDAKHYVPAGSFVTAVMTGGAEANAGVSGESATSPVLFEMLNGGFLPNGHHTKLKGCTMTGSAYGDISSSRGIVRGDRLSCIRKDGSVLDIPVEATVFNFGKNGIAGTAIMRNSKIIQSAGIAGILTGLGDAAKGASQTQSTSALGTTNSVDPSKAGLNMLGSATSEVASKLSDYYLKLAEKYHPDIELRQGAVVNIVFLKGFPLYDTDDYTEKMDKAREKKSAVTQMTANPVAAVLGTAATLPNPPLPR